jgi:hypothetical protein
MWYCIALGLAVLVGLLVNVIYAMWSDGVEWGSEPYEPYLKWKREQDEHHDS